MFIDSFVSALIIPLNKVLIFKIMHYFGNYNHFIIVPIATFGSVCGSLANWYLGRMLLFAKMEYEQNKTIKPHKVAQNLSLILLLLFVWAPHIGGAISLFSGCVSTKLRLVILPVLTSHFLFYLYITYLA